MTQTPRYAVIGLGRFGSRLAIALTGNGAEVIAIDRDPTLVERHRDEVTLAVRMDSTVEEALRAQGVDRVDAAIVAIGEDFESTALTVALLKSIGVRQIFARAETEVQAKILSKIGAHSIINPEREAAYRWAHRLMLPNLQQYVELGEGHSLIYTVAPTAFHHKTPLQLKLRADHGVNLIAINRPEQVPTTDGPETIQIHKVYVPNPHTTILPNDVLVLVGADERLAALPRD